MTARPFAVCQGEILIDLVAVGAGARIEDAATFHRAPGGAPANVAVGLARLGVPTAFVGKVSDDAFGRLLRETLERDGVDVTGLITDPAARTPLAFVGSDGAGGRTWIFYHRGMADTILRPDELAASLIGTATLFHFGAVSLAAEPGRSATLAAARMAREAGALVSFDPNVRLELWDGANEARDAIHAAIPLADVVKVSLDEIGLLFGTADPAAACRSIRDVGPALAVVTLGASGCWFDAPAGRSPVDGVTVEAVETTGAGDAFVAGLLSRLAPGGRAGIARLGDAQLLDAFRFANAVGALATTRYGAIPSLPRIAEVDAFLASLQPAAVAVPRDGPG